MFGVVIITGHNRGRRGTKWKGRRGMTYEGRIWSSSRLKGGGYNNM